MELTSERRTLVAILLCMFIYLGWAYLQAQKHKHDPLPPAPTAQTALGKTESPAAPGSPAAAAAPATIGAAAAGTPKAEPKADTEAKSEPKPPTKPEEVVEIETPELHVALSSFGATLSSVRLKAAQYRRDVDGKEEPVDLGHVTSEGHRPLETTFEGLTQLPADAPYEVTRDPDGRGATFVIHSGAATIEKHFRMVAPYLAELDVKVVGADPGQVHLSYPGVQPPGSAASASLFGLGRSVPNLATGICRVGSDTQRGSGGTAKDIKVKTESFPASGATGQLAFAGLDERFFVAAVYPAGPETRGRCTVASLASTTVSGALELPLKVGEEERFGVYLGPKDINRLRSDSKLPEGGAGAASLESSIDFGFWTALCIPMLVVMQFFYSNVVHNWGLAILCLTLAIKLVLFPLQQKFFKTQEQMRKLTPQIDALKKKHANDKEKLNQETMKLYSDNGANPFSSCLPMLLQLPIWFALYRLLGTTVELYREPFITGWINDLTAPDPVYGLPLGMGATMVVTQFLTPQTTLDNTQAKFMMWFMPIFMTATFLKVPAGLSLYIVASNLLNIAQQYWLRRRYGPKTEDNDPKKLKGE